VSGQAELLAGEFAKRFKTQWIGHLIAPSAPD